MTTSYRDWQPGHLQLSATTLQALRHGLDHDVKKLFGLALHELVGMGLLIPHILQSGHGSATVHTTAFVTGQPAPDGLERPLKSVLDAEADATEHEGRVTVQDVARTLRGRHGGKLSQWVQDEILPVLIDHKLYEKHDKKRLGIIPTTSTDITAEGRAARAQLEESIKRAEDQWSRWASDDTTRAQTFLDLAGSAVLLLPDIRGSILDFRTARTGAVPASTAAGQGTPRFDIDRLALYAHELKVMDDVIRYTDLADDGDHDPSKQI